MMEPDGRFNLRMINGARKPYITHSKTRSDAPYLLELEACSTITMHPKDASARVWQTEIVSKFSVLRRAGEGKFRSIHFGSPGTIDAQYGWKVKKTRKDSFRDHGIPSGYAPYFEVNVEVRKVGSQNESNGNYCQCR